MWVSTYNFMKHKSPKLIFWWICIFILNADIMHLNEIVIIQFFQSILNENMFSSTNAYTLIIFATKYADFQIRK